MSPGESISLWKETLLLTLVYNKGAAFGTMQENGWLPAFISIIVLFPLLYIFFKTPLKDSLTRLGLSFIISGALGNIYDRIVYGYVIDFIDIDIPDIIKTLPRWPVFNFADSCITIGMILVIIKILFNQKESVDAPNSI